MINTLMSAVILLSVVTPAVLIGCGESSQDVVRKARKAGKKATAKVYVDVKGTIILNRRVASRVELKAELDRLKKLGGTVWYSRARPEGEPPPNAMDVMKLIAAARLPIRFFRDKSFKTPVQLGMQ